MAATQRTKRGRSGSNRKNWESLDDESLLRLRFRDLKLRLANSLIEPDIARLYGELERRGFRFRPHIWLSTEWFSPDGIPGIAVPFFAAHPRLRRLEHRMLGEVEGGNRKWRLRILRHETGHALDNAYRLRRRKDWREVFGASSRPYPRGYTVRPRSRDYVQHIGYWYAQSHPVEDFAETFAVWMQPKARWRREYEGWPALEKLEFVDELMGEISPKVPTNRNRSFVAPLSQNSRTLGEHYRRKTSYADRVDRRYDDWLRETFAQRTDRPRGARASRFIRDARSRLRKLLLAATQSGPYLIDHSIDRITLRARQLDLVVVGSRRDNMRNVAWLLENVVHDIVHRNKDYFDI